MLTGDNERVAESVAEEVGLTGFLARLLPAAKTDAVRVLKERYDTVAMVGDGVNDAPALAAADVGIAMGAAGTDTALETADVALMRDDLSALPGFFALSRRAMRTIVANISFSIGVKAIFLVLAVTGRATLVDGGVRRHGRVAAGHPERDAPAARAGSRGARRTPREKGSDHTRW